MSSEKELGAPPSGSGCQPTASAADASSQSGIPSVAHTPGPWKFRLEAVRTVIFHEALLGERALAVGAGSYPDHIANARLIAAAPDLLAALQAAVEAQRLTDEEVEMIEYHAAHGMDDATGGLHCFSARKRADEAWNKAHALRDAAIAKATGGAA